MTEINQLIVTGDAGFLNRYRYFYEALAARCRHLETLVSGDVYNTTLSGNAVKALYKIARLADPKHSFGLGELHKQKSAFLRKSQQTAQKIRRPEPPPDFVIHQFGMYTPVQAGSAIPYAMSLDYTMALAVRQWPLWAPFPTNKARRGWLEAERDAYECAFHLFPWSHVVKRSLMEDCGILENKITVISNSGQFRHPYEGAKALGSRQLIFNGSEWERKGGDIVLAAFSTVRQSFPDASLVIVGAKNPVDQPGVVCLGYVSSASEMQTLFLASDLLVAPARCEPYGGFPIEGMNYGVPALVSGDAVSEIVDHEVNGLVLPAPTAEHLAGGILSLFSDPARLARYSAAARDKVRTELNWDRVAAKIFDALEHRGFTSSLPDPPAP